MNPCSLRGCIPAPFALLLQTTAQDDAREATEKMIVAQMQRDRLRQRLQALDPEAASEAAAEADAIASGTSSAGDVVKEQLERIAELEREVKRLKQISRWGWAQGAGVQAEMQAACRCFIGAECTLKGWMHDVPAIHKRLLQTRPACCRLSSAFAVTRRQSMGDGAMPDPSLHEGSFQLAPHALLGGSDGAGGVDAGSEEHDISALELQDEEFVTKEHAHTCVCCRPAWRCHRVVGKQSWSAVSCACILPSRFAPLLAATLPSLPPTIFYPLPLHAGSRWQSARAS